MSTVTETSDAAARASTDYSIAVGDHFHGTIGARGDEDWVAVTLEAGRTYSFAMGGIGALGDGLNDSLLALYDSSGTRVARDDDSGPGSDSAFTYTAGASGTYYIVAGAYGGSGTGAYGLSVSAGTTPSYDTAMAAGALLRDDLAWTSTAGQGVTVTWGIRASGQPQDAAGNAAGFATLSTAQAAAAAEAIALYSGVSGLDLSQVNPGGTTNNATILFGAYSSEYDGAGAYAYFPGPTSSGSPAGDVWINNASVSADSLPVGSFDHFVLLHELGHAVGLSHPGDYNATAGGVITYGDQAAYLEDSYQYSVMSYFDESNTTSSIGGYPDTLLLHDIQALQQLYGVNYGYHAGDSVYGFNSTLGGAYDFSQNSDPFLSIWDGGGRDRLDLSGFGGNQFITLVEGEFSDIGGYRGNVSIAYGAEIEEAVGGSGDDTLQGNALDNTLLGGGHDDLIRGGDGNDTIDGEGGADSIDGDAGHDLLTGGRGYDLIRGGTGADTIDGSGGDDTLYGDSSTDLIYGGLDNDLIAGGTGSDTIYGDAGDDSLYGNTAFDTIYGGDGDDFISSGDGADFVDGGAGSDMIYGRTGVDLLRGGDDNDSMWGSEGDDVMYGDAGNDYLSGGSALDQLHGGDGNDTLYGNFGEDQLWGDAGNDELYGGSGYDTLRGGDGNDTLLGMEGKDWLFGGAGNDLLRGGTNYDSFVFDVGHDNDEISDFDERGDALRLSTALTGGLTDADAILSAYGSDAAGVVLLDFGGGDSILFSNLTELSVLSDNIFTFA